MATYTIRVSGKGLKESQVRKLADACEELKGASVSVSKEKELESRADRFSAAIDDVSSAKSEMESLKDELEQWKESLPENLQSGSMADELDNAISELETIIENLDEAEGSSVEFPGMY